MEYSFSKLESIWQEVGLDRQSVSDHYSVLQQNVYVLMDDMIREEVARRQKITNNIETHISSVCRIAEELGQSPTAEVCDCTYDSKLH